MSMGLSHVANGAPSSEHSKRLSPEPVSVPEKANVMDVDEVFPSAATAFLFPSMTELKEVFGGTVSIVQINDAGDASSFPTLSEDLISIV